MPSGRVRPVRGPRPPDVVSPTQTPAAPGAPAVAGSPGLTIELVSRVGPTSVSTECHWRSIRFRRCTLSLQPGIPRPTQLLRRYGVGWAMIAAEKASADPSVARPGPTRLRHAGPNFQGPIAAPAHDEPRRRGARATTSNQGGCHASTDAPRCHLARSGVM